MKRIPTRFESIATFVRRSLLLVATIAAVCGVSVSSALADDVFYTTSQKDGGTELSSIQVTGHNVTTTDIGPMGGGCVSLALSAAGTLFSMCGDLFGTQHLATVDPNTGHAHPFGVPITGLAVMATAFSPDGILYAVGDCNPAPVNFECNGAGAHPDPNYNSLYTVNTKTGAFTRVGATGAAQFFMDLKSDREGTLFGVTTTLNPSYTPAILYRFDPATGAATKVADLIGSSQLMGLAFGGNGKLYATDFVSRPGLYLIDPETGFESAIAAPAFGFSSNLVRVGEQKQEQKVR